MLHNHWRGWGGGLAVEMCLSINVSSRGAGESKLNIKDNWITCPGVQLAYRVDTSWFFPSVRVRVRVCV